MSLATRHRVGRACFAVALLVASVLAFLGAPRAYADEGRRARVVVVPIQGTVDLATVPLVKRALDRAERERVDLVVLDIDTLGGRLDAAVAIRDRLLSSKVRTLAFIHPRAISAGALIALSSESVVMQDGGTIGAATPIQVQPSGVSSAVDAKATSYVRKEFRATAERRGRPALLAEAMVDADVDVAELAPAGKLLTLTTGEAVEHGIADARADDLAAALAYAGIDIGAADVRPAAHTWAEHVVRIVTHPFAASLLMMLGMLGLFVEIRTPGFGVPGLLGIAFLALFFGGHFIAELAGYETILLAVIGIVLLALEVFVLPGFGVAGVLGLLSLGGAFVLSLVGAGATAAAIASSVGRIGISFFAAVAAFIVVMTFLPRLPFGRGIVLTRSIDADDSPRRNGREVLVGNVGTTLTPLRPAGTALIDGARVDVVADGEFVPRGERVQVIQREGHRVVVRAAPNVAPDRSSKRRSESWSV